MVFPLLWTLDFYSSKAYQCFFDLEFIRKTYEIELKDRVLDFIFNVSSGSFFNVGNGCI